MTTYVERPWGCQGRQRRAVGVAWWTCYVERVVDVGDGERLAGCRGGRTELSP